MLSKSFLDRGGPRPRPRQGMRMRRLTSARRCERPAVGANTNSSGGGGRRRSIRAGGLRLLPGGSAAPTPPPAAAARRLERREAPHEGVADQVVGAGPRRGLLLQQPPDQLLQRRAVWPRQHLRLRLTDHQRHRQDGPRQEGHLQATELVEHHAQRPNVHLAAVGPPLADLGCEVGGRSHQRQRLEGGALEHAAQAEVTELDLAAVEVPRVAEHEDVRGLDVPVHDPP
mmetsp:Transcript_121210/g.387238  ORF Transcript_121210/g.387238 Transcript_121210/m.387238 type:complete len:228 (+) Transcript_121210:214-897(+)